MGLQARQWPPTGPAGANGFLEKSRRARKRADHAFYSLLPGKSLAVLQESAHTRLADLPRIRIRALGQTGDAMGHGKLPIAPNAPVRPNQLTQ